MKHELRKMIRRTALPTALALPLMLAVPGVAAADDVPCCIQIQIETGQVIDLAQRRAVQVGDVIANLAENANGTCAVTHPVGVIYAPLASGMEVSLDIQADCTVVVSSIVNSALDVVDDVVDLTTLSPGAGLPALPASADDAVPDPNYLTNTGVEATSIYTCKHQAWAKSTVLDESNTTATETREQVNWSSTGYNECYGRSVSNMVVNTSNKYTYCYAAWWELSNNDGCWYHVQKDAPNDTWADLWGDMQQQGTPYYLHSYNWAGLSIDTPWVPGCWIDNGQLHRGSKLKCKSRQDK
jgi:hypothetical protein